MIVTGKSLSRRMVLKGIGTTIALPFLDAMTPAFAGPAASAAPVRLAWFYLPNGIDMRHWTPGTEGALPNALPEILSPLNNLRSDITVLSNLLRYLELVEKSHFGLALEERSLDFARDDGQGSRDTGWEGSSG